MKKMNVRLAFLTAAALACWPLTAQAGTWRQGMGGDKAAWWYDEGNGTFPTSTWRWLDGNQDGVAECYYFDETGKMLQSARTPDGYTVDENGAWYLGFVRRKYVLNDQQTEVFKEAVEGLLTLYEEELYGPPGVDIQTRLKMDAGGQLALLKNLLAQSVRNQQTGAANPIFTPLRVEGDVGFFNRDETLRTFEALFGRLKDGAAFDQLGGEELSVTASAPEHSYRITSCACDSDGTFIYMKMEYEKLDQGGELLRDGAVYVQLLSEDSAKNQYTIDCIGNRLSLG